MSGGIEFPEIAASGNQEIDMGSAATLKKLIDFSKANFPASSFGLILMAHGLGTGGFSADDELGGRLHCGEIKEVLTDAQSVNLLGFNSCLMGNVETAYQFRNDSSNPGFKADVMLAPPGTTHILGWDYASVFTRIDISKGGTLNGETELVTGGDELFYSPAGMTPEQLGLLFVEEHRDYMYSLGSDYGNADSLVLYDLASVKAVKEAFDDLAVSLDTQDERVKAETTRNDPYKMIRYFRTYVSDELLAQEKTFYPYYDLKGFCESINLDGTFSQASRDKAAIVIAAVNTMVMHSYFGSYLESADSYRLSFFFPTGDGLYQDQVMFRFQWWYNAQKVEHIPSAEKYYGFLDWCVDKKTNVTGEVDNWFELLDAWYDPDGNDTDGGVNYYQY